MKSSWLNKVYSQQFVSRIVVVQQDHIALYCGRLVLNIMLESIICCSYRTVFSSSLKWFLIFAYAERISSNKILRFLILSIMFANVIKIPVLFSLRSNKIHILSITQKCAVIALMRDRRERNATARGRVPTDLKKKRGKEECWHKKA